MRLSKSERELVRLKCGGRCAYCGDPLGERWHADHFEAVWREWWKKGGGHVYPERDVIENLMPACVPCNLDKHSFTLEQWRTKLSNGPDVLARNEATYRHSLRFGLLQLTGSPIVFFFERQSPAQTASGCSHTDGPDDQSKVDDQEPTTGSSHG